MPTRQQVIQIAASQIGVGTDATSAKYAQAAGLGWTNKYAWCCAFVVWVMYQAGFTTSQIMRTGSCTAERKFLVSKGQYSPRGSYTPLPGDIIYFHFSSGHADANHTGIVEKTDGSKVYTIEGNTSNKCARRSYSLNSGSIMGYGRPVYDGSGTYTDATSGSSTVDTEVTEPPHVPQTEKVWTVYQNDVWGKKEDRYKLVWKSYRLDKTRDITDRCGNIILRDDSASLCTELTFDVMQSTDERFVWVLELEPGDIISLQNTATGECVFLGQIQSSSGSYRDVMNYTCQDQGRILACNDVIMQFNNIAAKDAISKIGKRLGIDKVSCPNLISSVYGIYKDNAATIIQNILETVTSENGVKYFPRMLGNTLTIRSYAQTPINVYSRQAANVTTFDVLKEVSAPSISRSIADLRNEIVVYSEQDNSVSIKADIENAESIKRYGRRVGLDTFSDSDKISATQKAKNLLASMDMVTESFTVSTYGSDVVVAGARITLDLEEAKGDYWVQSVEHQYSDQHTMTMTLEKVR